MKKDKGLKKAKIKKTKPAMQSGTAKKYFTWETVTVLVTVIAGILLHFAYAFSMNNKLVALIAPINESVWEHLKLAFWPALILSIVHYVRTKPKFKNYIVALAGMLATFLFIIPTFFYTYSGIVGSNFLAIDVAIFILAVIFGWYMYFCLIAEKNNYSVRSVVLSTVFVAALTAAFLIFTYMPPAWGIFTPAMDGCACGIGCKCR